MMIRDALDAVMAEQWSGLRTQMDALHRLCQAAQSAEETLRHVAAIAHMGGLAGLCPNDALVYIRKLTLDYLDYRGDALDRSLEKVRAALDAASP